MTTTYKFTGLFDGKVVKEHTGTLEEVKTAAGFGISPDKEAALLLELMEYGIGDFTESSVPVGATQAEKDFVQLLGLPLEITTRIEVAPAAE